MHQHQLARKRPLFKKNDSLELLSCSKEHIHKPLLSFLRTFIWGWESRKGCFRAWSSIPSAIQPAGRRIRRTSPFKKHIRNIALSCSEALKKENFFKIKLGERRKVSYLILSLISSQLSHFLAQIHWGYMHHSFHFPVAFPTTPQFIGSSVRCHSFQSTLNTIFLALCLKSFFQLNQGQTIWSTQVKPRDHLCKTVLHLTEKEKETSDVI